MKKLLVSLFFGCAATQAFSFEIEEHQYECQDELGSTFSLDLSYDQTGEMAIAIAYPGEKMQAISNNAIDLVWLNHDRSFRFYWLSPGDDEQNNICTRDDDNYDQ